MISDNKVLKLYLRKSISADWKLYVITLMCLIITGAARSKGADYTQIIMQHILKTDQNAFTWTLVICCLIQLINYSFKFFSAFFCMRIKTNLTRKLRVDILEKISRISIIRVRELNSGTIISILRNDVWEAANLVYILYSRIGVSILTSAFTFLYMLRIHRKLTIAILIIVVSGGAINQYVLNQLRDIDKESKKTYALLSNRLLSIYHVLNLCKIYNGQKYEIDGFKLERKKYDSIKLLFTRVNCRRISIYNLASNIVLLSSTLILAFRVGGTQITVEKLTAYIILVTQLQVSIEMVYRWAGTLQESLAGWDRIGEIMKISEEDIKELSNPTSLDIRKNVIYEDLSFGYTQKDFLYQNLNMSFEINNIYLFTGRSGSGKTTLFYHLMGAIDSGSGKVSIDGRYISFKMMMKLVSFVPAESILFQGTILDNIVMFDKYKNIQKINTLLNELDMDGWIRTLPHGYDTMVYERGNNLSGGQRKLICILRAIYYERPILILDEPFAALDKAHRASLAAIMKKIKQTRIVIYTNHSNEDTLPRDKEYILSNGRLKKIK